MIEASSSYRIVNFCDTWSIKPEALAITAAALLIIAAASAYNIPSSSYIPTRTLVAAGTALAVGATVIVVARLNVLEDQNLEIERTENGVYLNHSPRNQPKYQLVKALLKRFQITNSNIKISPEGIEVDGHQLDIEPNERHLLHDLANNGELPLGGLNIHLIQPPPSEQNPVEERNEPIDINLLSLPDELLIGVIQYLKMRDVLSLGRSNSRFYHLSEDLEIWKEDSRPLDIQISPRQWHLSLWAHGKKIETLRFCCNSNIEEGGQLIPRIPLYCPNLQELNLRSNGISAEQFTTMANNFQHSQKLRNLDLMWNDIGNNAASIVNTWQNFPNLEILNLTWNSIPLGAFRPIINSLQDHPNLRCLNLANNNVDPDRVTEIVQNLNNPNLKLIIRPEDRTSNEVDQEEEAIHQAIQQKKTVIIV